MKDDSIGAGGRQRNPPATHRRAMFEDRAKPVWVSLPLVAVAAVAVLLVGRFVSSRRGRQLGRDGKKDKGISKKDGSGGTDSLKSRQSNQPMNLAELRRLRAEAAEARMARGSAGKNDASAAKPTALGMILQLTRKVDELEKEADYFLLGPDKVKGKQAMSENGNGIDKARLRLLELLTQVQLEIDAIKTNESSIRQHRKTQTTRVQKLISALECSLASVSEMDQRDRLS